VNATKARKRPQYLRGRLAQRYPFWKAIGASVVVLAWVLMGYMLPLTSEPEEYYAPNHGSCAEYAEPLSWAVEDLLLSGAAMLVEHRPHICSPLGIIAKPGQPGKYRIILDLRYLNTFLPKIPFKYEGVKDATYVFQPNDWLFTIDLTSGYHHLGIHHTHWRYLGFQFENRYYVFTALPFGLSVACWVFTTLMRTVVKHWRRRFVRLIHYLDDMGFAARTRAAALTLVASVLCDLENLGFVVNFDKSVLDPAQAVKLLGFIVDTVKQQFRVTDSRRNKLLAALNDLVAAPRIQTRRLLGVAGQLMSMRLALGQVVSFFSRAMYRLAASAHQSWNMWLTVTAAVRTEAAFWLRVFDMYNGTAIWDYRVYLEVVAWVDASRHAWGGHTDSFGARGVEARGSHPAHLVGKDSTYLEMYGYLMLLQALEHEIKGRPVRLLLHTDSQAGHYLVGDGGGHMREDYNELLAEIYFYCIQRQIVLIMHWVPREENVAADALTNIKDDADLMLDTAVFADLHSNPFWGPFGIDRTATHLNSQLPTFNSRWACPGTSGVNCFRFNWFGVNNWSNPDFAMIAKIFRHMSTCRARGAVLVPVWPSRPWWAMLYPFGTDELAPWILHVRHLPSREGLFRFAFGGSSRPAPAPRFDCMVLKVDFSVHQLP
jgi:hypothetical protein